MNSNDLFQRMSELAAAREVELRLSIKRILAGDKDELVRAVVERVTEAIEVEVANVSGSVPDDVMDKIIMRMCDAKFQTFRDVTGFDFTTTSNRILGLRSKIASRKTVEVLKDVPDDEELP